MNLLRVIVRLLLGGALLAAALAHAQGSVASSAPATASAPSLSAALPLRREPEPVGASYAAWMALAVIAAGAGALLFGVKSGRWPLRARSRGQAGASAPKLVATRPLGAHATLQVVEWNGKELLLGCSAHSVAVLDSRPLEGREP